MRRLTAVLATILVAGTQLLAAIPLQAQPAEGATRPTAARITSACEAAAYLERHHWPDVRNGSFRDVPCTEVDRAIHESAAEFRIDEVRFRRMIWCESKFHPFAGRAHRGLTQAGASYWRTETSRFNDNLSPGQPQVLNNVLSPFDNARVAARVIAREGYGQWSCKGL